MSASRNETLRQRVIENLQWFLASLAVAVLVWFIASTQLDPIVERSLTGRVPIRVQPDDGLLITNEDALNRTARVVVRTTSSVYQLLAPDDIIVRADLDGLRSGTHVVELTWSIAPEREATIVDISPRQLTVTLEEELEILVPVRVEFTGELPAGFVVAGPSTLDTQQVRVSGPASQVEQVASARVEVNLDRQFTTFEEDVRPVPVDADGEEVENVVVETPIVRVTVPVETATP